MSNNGGKRITVLKIAVSALFTVGMLTFLKPCGPKEDGTWMHCHTAGQILLAASCAMLVVSLLSLLLREGAATYILSVLLFVLSAAVLLIPGIVISLCMMPEMRCRAIMRPGSAVFAVLMILLGILDLVLHARGRRMGKEISGK